MTHRAERPRLDAMIRPLDGVSFERYGTTAGRRFEAPCKAGDQSLKVWDGIDDGASAAPLSALLQVVGDTVSLRYRRRYARRGRAMGR